MSSRFPFQYLITIICFACLAPTHSLRAQENSVPALISPLEFVATATPTYTWASLDTVTKYRLQIWDRTKKSWAFNDTYNSGTICSGGTCSVTPDYVLPYSWNHIWRVRGKNETEWSSFTPNELFNYLPDLPPSPTLNTPIEDVNTATPMYTWKSQDTVTDYRLQIYDRTTKSWAFNSTYDVGAICSAGTCSVTPN